MRLAGVLEPTRVFLIAEDPLVREGLAMRLGRFDDLELVAEVATSAEATGLIPATEPDAVLWDVGLQPATWPGLSELAESWPPVVLLVSAGATELAETTGVEGVVGREADGTKLAAALRAVAAGLHVVEKDFTSPSKTRASRGSNTSLQSLTSREHEVLRWLAEGLSNKEIATRLSISEHTAKFHVNSILQKLGVTKRTEAVVRAARLGYVVL